MKKFIIIGIILCCSFIKYNNFIFNKNMEEGKIAITSKDYNSAKQLFEKAVDKNPKSREALGLYKQTDKLIQIINLDKEGNEAEAIELCANINNIYSEDSTIKEIANNLMKNYSEEIKKENEYETTLNARLNEAKSLVDNYDYGPGKVALNKIIEEIEYSGEYNVQLHEAQQYLEKCK